MQSYMIIDSTNNNVFVKALITTVNCLRLFVVVYKLCGVTCDSTIYVRSALCVKDYVVIT